MKSSDLLEKYGFQGSLSVGSLQAASFSRSRLRKLISTKVSAKPGVLAVVTPPGYVFCLREKVCKGKYLRLEADDKTATRWNFDTDIIFIGETGRTLPVRINELILHGMGKGRKHKGGQDIWLLKRDDSFLLYWKASEQPKKFKKELLEEFREEHNGNRPFGNKQG